MSQLTDDDVRHIAKLARLSLSDDEVSTFTKELGSILEYIDVLKEVDTSDVKETAHITGLSNSFRPDTIEDCDHPRDHIETSPLPIVDNQIQTPSAHG